MATRPVFESITKAPYYQVKNISFEFAPGFAKVQKQKNITHLHENYMKYFHGNQPLEISSKSLQQLGIDLSAFNLKDENGHSVECVFQSSKKFALGGPYVDLLEKTSKEAKKDERLRNSGRIVAFVKDGIEYPTEPKTTFYDWIYINALVQNKDLCDQLKEFDAFTDIEFNPEKSLNCQAEAVAIYCGLIKAGKLDAALSSFEDFVQIIWDK